MKIKKTYSEFNISEICKSLNITDYSINDDLSIDINGSWTLPDKLKKIPIKINKMHGSLYTNVDLESLENGPNWVSHTFDCAYSDINSLKYSPKYVGGLYTCAYTNIHSLEGSPDYVGGGFSFAHTSVKNLDGYKLRIFDNIIFENTPFQLLIDFIRVRDHSLMKEGIELIVELDVIQGNKIIMDRYYEVFNMLGIAKPSGVWLELLEKYYQLI